MAETRSYSHLEIQRYLQHKMSPQEMHEFERALMDDPFLADALEGFTASNPSLAEEHLAAIETSLINKGQPAKVVQLSSRKKSWWKAAAVVLVIVSGGAITYGIINNNEAPKKNKIATTTSIPSITRNDSVRPVPKPLAEMEVASNNRPSNEHVANPAPGIRRSSPIASVVRGQSKPDNRRAADTTKESELIATTNPSLAENDKVASAAAPQKAEEQIVVGYGAAKKTSSTPAALALRLNAANELKGKVAGRAGAPLSYADIAAARNGIAAVPDATGNFSLKSADSVDVNVTSPGFAARQKNGRSKTNDKISKDDEMTLAETVVTALSKKGRMRAVTIDSAAVTAEPSGGWKSFNQYFNQRLDSLTSPGDNTDFDEDLVLEFSVDNQGRPADIKTPVEIDKKISDKAKEILSNGPKWKNKQKDKKVKLVIAF